MVEHVVANNRKTVAVLERRCVSKPVNVKQMNTKTVYPEFRGQHGTASKNLGVKQSVLKSKARTKIVESRSY